MGLAVENCTPCGQAAASRSDACLRAQFRANLEEIPGPERFLRQETIGDTMNALDDKVALHREIVEVTEQLRDSLLPMLLTNPKQ
ncbi:hypothetical protein [Micromonospora sp. NPDC001898]|uniref:hypothetical protein n=1 Tax=Micromonospora sp. NPDC001898 TaxID=3364221 RepID=UPI003675CDD7